MRPALVLPPRLPRRTSDHRLVGYHLFVVGHATLQAKITQRGKGDSENEERFEWSLGMWRRKVFMSLELSRSARTYVTRCWMEWRSPIPVARGHQDPRHKVARGHDAARTIERGYSVTNVINSFQRWCPKEARCLHFLLTRGILMDLQ